MDEFLNPDLKPFSELSPAEMHCIVQAKLNNCCQFKNDCNVFVDTVFFGIDFEMIYRTKPKPVKKLAIQWKDIRDEVICAAMDSTRCIFLFSETPVKDGEQWICDDENIGIVFDAVILKIDTEGVDWKTSLTYRPGFEPKED